MSNSKRMNERRVRIAEVRRWNAYRLYQCGWTVQGALNLAREVFRRMEHQADEAFAVELEAMPSLMDRMSPRQGLALWCRFDQHMIYKKIGIFVGTEDGGKRCTGGRARKLVMNGLRQLSKGSKNSAFKRIVAGAL